MNIYQISQELLNIFNIIEENAGEITPEIEAQLNITQNDFKDKIKSYTDVIKHLQDDVVAIKQEKTRLSELQKSKEKTIDSLKKIIAKYVDIFGDTTKSGVKFVDYGTGVVKVRNTESVDVNQVDIDCFVFNFINTLSWYNYRKELSDSFITDDDILDTTNSKSEDMPSFSKEDLQNVKVNINADIAICDLFLDKRGFNLIKELINYGAFEAKGKANKIAIKRDATVDEHVPVFAKIVHDKTVNIK